MKDFTKWAAMWDAYNRMGEAVSGSPASICQDIGVTLMMVSGFVGLIAVAVIGGMGGDPEKSPFGCDARNTAMASSPSRRKACWPTRGT